MKKVHRVSKFYQKAWVKTYIYVNTSNYELEKPLSKGENEKLIESIKNELGEKIYRMEFTAWIPKTYRYLIDDYLEDKKEKRTKKYHQRKT